MSGIRRAPRPVAKPKPKRFVPIHQQILGKPQVELDTVEDLRYRLELVNDREEIDYETYLACHEALDVREAQAKVGLLKATGRAKVAAQAPPPKKVKAPRRAKEPMPAWQVKLVIVFFILFFLKISAMKA